MKVTEVGYYWYRNNGTLFPVPVQVDKGCGFMSGMLVVWFFGNEVEIPLQTAEKEGEFLKEVERYV